MPVDPVSPRPDQVLEQLRQDLPSILSAYAPAYDDGAPTLAPVAAPSPGDTEASFRIDGPGEVCFQADVEVFPATENAYELHIEIEEGDARHFPCEIQNGTMTDDERERVGRAVASFLINEVERRRIRSTMPQPALADVPPHVPLLILNEEGTIQDLTRGARHILEYSPDESIEPNFFSHVHGENLRRVMRDLASMVSHKKQRARWLVRLRTGNHRWRWCRVLAENHLDPPDPSIRLLLRPL